MSSFKEMLLDKAIDNCLDIIADTSKDELKKLLEKDRLQKILHKVFITFSKSPYFSHEYHDVEFIDDKDLIYSITDEKIRIIDTSEEIANNILPYITKCFISDIDDFHVNIAKQISELYLQRAKLTIDLGDLLQSQKEGFEEISEELEEIKDVILANFKYETLLKAEKEALLKKELNNEVSALISEIMNNYLYLLLKKAPTFSKDEMDDLADAKARKIDEVTDSIGDYITDDFCTVPVITTHVNGLQNETKRVNYFVFLECCFRKSILQGTNKILEYKDIIDIETYVFILRLRNKLHDNLFPPLIEMGQTNIINNPNISIDVEYFKKEFFEIGKLIVAIYRKLH